MSDLLFVGINGSVVAMDSASGREVWRTALQSGFFNSTHCEDVALIDHDGRVFAGANGHLFCLDARTGRQLWHSDLPGLGYNDVTLAIAGRTSRTQAPPPSRDRD